MAARNWTPEQRAEVGQKNEARHAKRRAERIEDLEFLLQWDHNAESIARRAGFTCAASAVRWLHRNGRPDLSSRLYLFTTDTDVHSDKYGAAAFGMAS